MSGASDSALEAARAHHRAGRLADAEVLYRQVLKDAPQHADALHLLGMLSFQKGRHDDAVELVQAALGVRDDDAEMHHDLGNVLEAKGDLDGAARSYREALALAPGHADAHYNLAGLYYRQGRVEEAIASYRAAIVAAPGQADAYNNLGAIYRAQGRGDDALGAYREAVARAPRVPVYRYNLGNTFLAQERFDEAIEAFHSALALAPAHAAARSNLGFALFGRGNALYAAGRLEDAAMSYGAAVTERPDYAPAHNNLGNVLDELGHAGPALASYRLALANDDAPTIRMNFARVLRTAGVTRDDPQLRRLAARALAEGWARPGELSRVAGALLALDPVMGPWIERGEPGDWDALAQEPLFEALLTRAPVADARLERFVTELRRALLEQASRADPSPARLAVACAIARQCFVNEYVFPTSDDEHAQVDALRPALDAGPTALALAAYAAYRPLNTLAHGAALAQREWPEPLRALIAQQVTEPAEEHRLAGGLATLTPLDDAVSRRVQAQYEANPYPRWIDLPAATPMPLEAWLGRQLPLARVPRDVSGHDILVAGCGTGQEAIETAGRHPDTRVLAVDLSRASLAYAQRMTQARGLANLEYAQADLARLPALGRRFDVVSAVGVLHHLADPLAGWRALLACLAPGGLMQVGLYSRLARRAVDAARAFVAARDDAPTPPGIRRARAALRAEGARFARVTALRDFFATSECRDLLFHVQERSFTLPQIGEALEALGLELVGLVVEPAVLRAYRQAHPHDETATDLAGWGAFERANPDTFIGMYQFWVRQR